MARKLIGYFASDATDEEIADAIIADYERRTGKTVKPDEPAPRNETPAKSDDKH